MWINQDLLFQVVECFWWGLGNCLTTRAKQQVMPTSGGIWNFVFTFFLCPHHLTLAAISLFGLFFTKFCRSYTNLQYSATSINWNIYWFLPGFHLECALFLSFPFLDLATSLGLQFLSVCLVSITPLLHILCWPVLFWPVPVLKWLWVRTYSINKTLAQPLCCWTGQQYLRTQQTHVPHEFGKNWCVCVRVSAIEALNP